MSAEHPLKPLVDLGDAFNTIAPHNLLLNLASGGQSSTTPVLARQLTMYEEMNRVIPQERIYTPQPEPVPQAQPQIQGLDALLAIAPHNVLAAILGGGRLSGPSSTDPGAPAVGGALAGTTLQSMNNTSLTGKAKWKDPNTVLLAHNGDKLTIRGLSDRKLFLNVVTTEHTETFARTHEGGYNPWTFQNVKSSVLTISTPPKIVSVEPITVSENQPQFSLGPLTGDVTELISTSIVKDKSTVTYTNKDIEIRLVGVTPSTTVPGKDKLPKTKAPAPKTFNIEGYEMTFEQALARAQNLEAMGNFEGAKDIYDEIGVPYTIPEAPPGPSGMGGGPGTPDTFMVDGVLMTKEQALDRIAFLKRNNDWSAVARAYDAIEEPSLAASARSKIQAAAETGPVANIYWGGPNPPKGNYTRADLMNSAASMKYSDPSSAIDIYDTLGETSKANALRDKLASAQAAAQQAQQSVMDMLAQARTLEAQGRYGEAATLYTRAGYPNLATNASNKGSSADKKAAAKAKAQEIARQVLAAKMAAKRK